MSFNIEYKIPGMQFTHTKKYIYEVAPKNILMHTDEYYEIYISHTEKPINYYYDSTLFLLTAGDLIITPPGIWHCAFMQPGNTLQRTRIGIDLEGTSEFQGLLDIVSTRTGHPYHLKMSEYQKCLQYIENMEIYAQQVTRTSAFHMILEGFSILLYILENSPGDQTQNGIHYPRLLQEILYYIQENNRFLTISGNKEIAEHFHVSVNYIPRLFKLYYPISLKTLILNLKIQYATTLLDHGATVTEACYSSGFSDCSHFISTFRKITGTTPGKYKNNADLPNT